MSILWALLALPTVLWWRESILWIALLSIYSNFISELGAFQSAKTRENVEDERKATKSCG